MSSKLLTRFLIPSVKCTSGCNNILIWNSVNLQRVLVSGLEFTACKNVNSIFSSNFHTTPFTNDEDTYTGRRRGGKQDDVVKLDPKDRSKVIPVETSMRYLKSDAYKSTYGSEPVWLRYRRNFPGPFLPLNTRRKCIKHERVVFGSPCPICRDEYLVVDYRNTELLKQFISPFTDKLLTTKRTQVCRQQYKKIAIAIDQAKELGLITYYVPFRKYNYDEFRPKEEV